MTAIIPRTTKRRVPTQQRAKERVEHILSVAEAMIVEGGVGSLKTNEIAERAGVPVGSVYQYFSGLEDMIGALVDRYHILLEGNVGAIFGKVNTAEEFLAALKTTQDMAWAFLFKNKGYRELWCGAQTWAPLRHLDWADTLKNADTMNKALCRVFPNIVQSELRTFCIMFCDSSGSIARMAIEFPDLREALLNENQAMLVARFLEFSRRNILNDAT
jgi:AcrR family transcriptional regulator